jgi:hypothetical protein
VVHDKRNREDINRIFNKYKIVKNIERAINDKDTAAQVHDMIKQG